MVSIEALVGITSNRAESITVITLIAGKCVDEIADEGVSLI